MRKKTLKGIKPFNDCWFRTCYYHQLMAGMSYFGVPSEYIVYNFATEIALDKEKGDYAYRSKDVLDEVEFVELTGVREERSKAEDVIGFVVKSIGRNRPVIVGQDNYCIPYRPELNKTHGAHFVLVFGYDVCNRTFTLIEHSFASGLDFCPRQVSFDIVAKAHKGFCDNCGQYGWSVAELSKSGDETTFARRRELINKLCEPLHRVQLGEYLQVYDIMRKTAGNNTERTMETSIQMARYLRARMLQYEKYCAEKEILIPLEKVWQCAHFMQGVAMKANHVKSAEIYGTKAVEGKLSVMLEESEKFEKAVRRL